MASVPTLQISEFIDIANQTLEFAFSAVILEGEVESFKVSQGKFVFFNLKDSSASIGCFMMVFQLRIPIEDGMKVVVRARPKLTKWGKFSLTVDAIQLKGAGQIKRSFDILKEKLENEGLFASERKRLLPSQPQRVGVLASVESAGYADFMKIANDRWGGVSFTVYHSQVQGFDAATQLIDGIRYFNDLAEPPEVLVIIRGGGSADDLAVFNDEQLVRVVAQSAIPTVAGIGHEVDVTLTDLVVDSRASTPSNAAELLVPDRRALRQRVVGAARHIDSLMLRILAEYDAQINGKINYARQTYERRVNEYYGRAEQLRRLLDVYNPQHILQRGYAVVRGTPRVGDELTIETINYKATVEVRAYEQQ